MLTGASAASPASSAAARAAYSRGDRQRHGRSACFRRASPLRPQGLAGVAQRLLPPLRVARRVGYPAFAPERGVGRPHGDGLGVPARLRAQVTACVKAVVNEQVVADPGGEIHGFGQMCPGLGQAAGQQVDIRHEDQAISLVEHGTRLPGERKDPAAVLPGPVKFASVGTRRSPGRWCSAGPGCQGWRPGRSAVPGATTLGMPRDRPRSMRWPPASTGPGPRRRDIPVPRPVPGHAGRVRQPRQGGRG